MTRFGARSGGARPQSSRAARGPRTARGQSRDDCRHGPGTRSGAAPRRAIRALHTRRSCFAVGRAAESASPPSVRTTSPNRKRAKRASDSLRDWTHPSRGGTSSHQATLAGLFTVIFGISGRRDRTRRTPPTPLAKEAGAYAWARNQGDDGPAGRVFTRWGRRRWLAAAAPPPAGDLDQSARIVVQKWSTRNGLKCILDDPLRDCEEAVIKRTSPGRGCASSVSI